MTHPSVWRQYRAAMIVADALAIAVAYIVADIIRCHLRMHADWPEFIEGYGSSVRIHMKVLALLPLGWPAILYWLGWYEPRWRSWRWFVRSAVLGTALLGLMMSALALLFERELYPRAQIAYTCGLAFATTLGLRGISGLIGRRVNPRHRRHVLIVGTGRDAVRLRRLVRFAALGRPKVLGHLRGPWETDEARTETGAILGDASRLGSILDEQVVDEVIFSVPLEALPGILPYVRMCEEVGVTAHVQAESMASHWMPELTNFHGVPLLTYSPARHSPELLSVKRVLDLAFAIIGIAATGPIILICAVAIKLSSPGPVLFRQRRSGLNGRVFRMYKFRTMELDAEEKQTDLLHLNESKGPVFKISDDPRVTWLGRLLRRWSLDELPQLFNVLAGDMSIVGPRPPIPSEVDQYDRWQRRRLSMRPGLTCLWQVKGRHRLGFDEWMRLDLFYIDNWSLRLDFLIIWRTVSTVLAGTGV